MIAEALHTGVLFYLSGLLSLLGGLSIVNLNNMAMNPQAPPAIAADAERLQRPLRVEKSRPLCAHQHVRVALP